MENIFVVTRMHHPKRKGLEMWMLVNATYQNCGFRNIKHHLHLLHMFEELQDNNDVKTKKRLVGVNVDSKRNEINEICENDEPSLEIERLLQDGGGYDDVHDSILVEVDVSMVYKATVIIEF